MLSGPSREPFLELEPPKPAATAPFSLDSRRYERLIARERGDTGLEAIAFHHSRPSSRHARPKPFPETYRGLVPYFHESKDEWHSIEKLAAVIAPYRDVPMPCAMRLDSVEELAEHAVRAYQVSHAHYVLARDVNLRGTFPCFCCGASSRNVALSLLLHGYPNAVTARSKEHDHVSVLLPFVLPSEEAAGSIVIDPTSDQLWRYDGPRNATFVTYGDRIEYTTDWWGRGRSMDPSSFLTVRELFDVLNDGRKRPYFTRFAHLDEIKLHEADFPYAGFLEQAFQHPVELSSLDEKPVKKTG